MRNSFELLVLTAFAVVSMPMISARAADCYTPLSSYCEKGTLKHGQCYVNRTKAGEKADIYAANYYETFDDCNSDEPKTYHFATTACYLPVSGGCESGYIKGDQCVVIDHTHEKKQTYKSKQFFKTYP